MESFSPSASVSATSSLQLRRRLGVGDQRRVADLLPCLGQAGDVVAMGMGDEDVGDLDPVALGPLQQRPEVVVAVDQHPLAAGVVGDQVGVRQPARVLGPLDDHGTSSVRLQAGRQTVRIGALACAAASTISGCRAARSDLGTTVEAEEFEPQREESYRVGELT